MSTTPLVDVLGLRKTFLHSGRQIEVLRDIRFSIAQGELLSIVGMSGVGKSTLLQILGALDVPSAGQLLFEGVDVFSLSPQKLSAFRNRSIGFVFQFHHLLPDFSALENAMMPCLISRMPRREAQKRASALLEEVGLGHRLSHRPRELSGGEQQRVALARALVMEPKLVLADEPTGNLDRLTSEEVHKLFVRVNRDKKIAMVLVTHNPQLAAMAPRQLHMIDGRIVEAPREELRLPEPPSQEKTSATSEESAPAALAEVESGC